MKMAATRAMRKINPLRLRRGGGVNSGQLIVSGISLPYPAFFVSDSSKFQSVVNP
jgi:hypothetical protein